MKKMIRFALGLVAAAACLCLTACGDQDGGKTAPTQTTAAESAGELAAPSDFSFDTKTGDFTFTANDANAGYYFVRAYQVVDGKESTEYTTSSSRINGGSAGSKSGSLDASLFGWGTYHIKLITFAAAGSGYQAPESTVVSASYGIGGVLERPEMLIMTDGTDVEFVPDWYTIGDYYDYQYLPEMSFSVYSDEACTAEVMKETVNLQDLLATIDKHPAGGYIWGYDPSSDHLYIGDQFGFKNSIYTYTLDAGTYYAVCQAVSNDEANISSSQNSEVVKFTVEGGARDGSYEAFTTSLWQTPEAMGVPCAAAGTYTDRVDFGQTQTTDSKTN